MAIGPGEPGSVHTSSGHRTGVAGSMNRERRTGWMRCRFSFVRHSRGSAPPPRCSGDHHRRCPSGQGPETHTECQVSSRITGGTVHDPANGVDGEVRDICIEDGRIVQTLPEGAPRLDVGGMVVMPGGVDIHSHLASSSCNHARRLLPEEHAADPAPAPSLDEGAGLPRSGTGGTSHDLTTDKGSGMGYTTFFAAAVAPAMARTVTPTDDTPCVRRFLRADGDDEYLLPVAAGERERARAMQPGC